MQILTIFYEIRAEIWFVIGWLHILVLMHNGNDDKFGKDKLNITSSCFGPAAFLPFGTIVPSSDSVYDSKAI